MAYKNYFGEKMCIRYAFFRFYTAWFALPALFSILIVIYQLNKGSYDVIGNIPFALLITIWSCIFIEKWKRKEYHI